MKNETIQLRRDQLLLHEHLSEQNRDLRATHMKSLIEMEESKRQSSSVSERMGRPVGERTGRFV